MNIRTCIHSRCIPSWRFFCRHSSLNFLEIRQDSYENLPRLAAKSLANPASPGYEYRFLLPNGEAGSHRCRPVAADHGG